MSVTGSNNPYRESPVTRRYALDPHGISSTALPPALWPLIKKLQRLDEETREARMELNLAAQDWLESEGMDYFYSLDDPYGPISFTPRKGEEGTRFIHNRTAGHVNTNIKRILGD